MDLDLDYDTWLDQVRAACRAAERDEDEEAAYFARLDAGEPEHDLDFA